MRFVFLIILLSCVFLGCSNGSNDNPKKINKGDIIFEESTNDSINLPNEVLDWVEEWKRVNPNFAIDSFKIYNIGPIEYILSSNYEKFEDYDIYNQLFSFSSDSSKYVDIYSYNTVLSKEENKTVAIFDVDAEASLVDIINKKKHRLLFLGSMGSFDDIYWINEDEFVIVGFHEDFSSHLNKTAYFPDIWHYNLKDNTVIHYLGSPCHNYINDYFERKFPEIIIE